jgi:hypothetical protein
MNVKTRKPVSALSVAARIPGGATTAVAVEIFCISGTMIPALVSPATHPLTTQKFTITPEVWYILLSCINTSLLVFLQVRVLVKQNLLGLLFGSY